MTDDEELLDANMSRLIEKMRVTKKTPYLLPDNAYLRQKAALLTGTILLKAKGHADMADYVESGTATIDRIPALDTDIANYLRALKEQMELSLEIWDYCVQNPEVADVLPYISFCRQEHIHAG